MTKTREEARALARKAAAEMTDEEDAALTAAAAADPDNPELDPAWVATARRTRSPGRPPKEAPKVPVTIRLDPDLLDRLKADGPGWQSRINETLRRAVGL